MGAGFDVDVDCLRRAASEIRGSVREVNVGEFSEAGEGGSGFGHEELHRAVVDFCSASETGIEMLVRNCDSASESLEQVARSYKNEDDHARSVVGRVPGWDRSAGGN